ncbi:MAG: hypothetical protein Q7S69_02240 [Nitrosomonadaceae bacterium]|nr:hypothetical protein [Nitrosomonadaceae bacterium]
MTRPFQVYLDSSDFSVLSDPSRRTQEIITLESQLISWRDAGLIEMRFAYSHLIEAAPMKPQYTEAFRCRAQKIAELCQGKALAAQNKIYMAEIRALSGEPVKNGYILWMTAIGYLSALTISPTLLNYWIPHNLKEMSKRKI